ncbi:MAG: hypothetical protein HY268_07210 [Deltaproteobacteria bacterium]|nr:hypothetical protein [Deltaproteobacteria bacterium]
MPQNTISDVAINEAATEIIPAEILNPTWMPEDVRGRESLKQLLFLVFKWRWLILSLPVVFMIATAMVMYVKPPVHTATAKILFKQDRVALQLADLTAASSKTPYSQQLLSSELELFRSRGVLLPAAKKLLTQKGLPIEEIGAEAIDSQVETLEDHLTVAQVPDSNLIQVNYIAQSAEVALRSLTSIMEEYQEQHSIAHSGSTELQKFYEQERDRAGTALHNAEEELRKWQEANNVVSFDQQIRGILEIQTALETELQRTETDIAKGTGERDPVTSRLKGDVITSEVALQDLLQRYTDQDRRVQEKKEELALLQGKLVSAEHAQQSTLFAGRDALRKQIREIDATLASLREKKFGFDRLSRLVSLNQDTFLLYGKKVEEARIAAGLDAEQLSNIAVIEQPYISSDSDLKKRLAIVILASVVGLMLGLGVAIGLALFNSSLRMEEDIEHYLKLPVLAVIPDLQRSVSS